MKAAPYNLINGFLYKMDWTTFSEDVYSNMNATKSCMKHTMDLQEEIFKRIQLQKKSNSQDYGGRRSTKIAKLLLVDMTGANDLVDLCQAQKCPRYP